MWWNEEKHMPSPENQAMTSISPSSRAERARVEDENDVAGGVEPDAQQALSAPVRLHGRHVARDGRVEILEGIVRHVSVGRVEKLGNGEQTGAAEQVPTAVALGEKVLVGSREARAPARLDVREVPDHVVVRPAGQVTDDGVTGFVGEGHDATERPAPPSGCLVHAPNLCKAVR